MVQGRQVLPQGDELKHIIDKHPDLSYPQIQRLYGWDVQPGTLRNAARRAGIKRGKVHEKVGGGPLDIMPHDEFWRHVDEVAMPKIINAILTQKSPAVRKGKFSDRDHTNDGDRLRARPSARRWKADYN